MKAKIDEFVNRMRKCFEREREHAYASRDLGKLVIEDAGRLKGNVDNRAVHRILDRLISTFLRYDELKPKARRNIWLTEVAEIMNVLLSLDRILDAKLSELKDLKIHFVEEKIGKSRKKRALLNHFNISTVRDLIHFYPRGYRDRKIITSFREIDYLSREEQTIAGRIVKEEITSFQGKTQTKKSIKVTIKSFDGEGYIWAVWWQQPWVEDKLRRGEYLIASGIVNLNRYEVDINVKEYHIFPDLRSYQTFIGGELSHVGRIVPIYPSTTDATISDDNFLRELIKTAVDNYAPLEVSPVPLEIVSRQRLMPYHEALAKIHFPDTREEAERARERLAFDELFMMEIGLAVRRRNLMEEARGIAFKIDEELLEEIYRHLPFSLTRAQKRVIEEIKGDMSQPIVMNRLLQGDVGSGKTIVALIAALIAASNGYQAAFMAPTEILAEQHYLNFKNFLKPFGIEPYLLTSSIKGRQREDVLEAIISGRAKIIVGTHALIQEDINFHKLGLAIVDEQHRFGVMQRMALIQKAENPDMLVMSATPIPRTLALSVYGDLDISIINEMPPGRNPVRTEMIRDIEPNRKQLYQWMGREIAQGRQIYVVCPLIEESEKIDLKAAMDEYELMRAEFPEARVGLIHGRMGTEERETTMREFKEGKIDILVSTTVIEVGVDVPNATMMIIEHAERFGLSQLHQLRGRVGRGAAQSHCILLVGKKVSRESRRRLDAMVRTTDGFTIAEEDLSIRGPGEFFGTRQSGMPNFRAANIMRDYDLMERARQEAFSLVRQDPTLSRNGHKTLKEILKKHYAKVMGVHIN
ncbi:MAG: ATP-dependent DNA helicase RecG [bacterium]